MESSSPTRYIGGLDGLRALAVAGVLAFHLGRLRGGYLGVDAFFVVSGFLITRLLVDEWVREGRIVLGRFWLRRIRRLVPALLLVLVGVALLVPYLAPDMAGRIRGDGFAALAYWANWHAIVSGGYFSRLASPSPLEHLWSLAVEEQFYAIWPLLLLLILRKARGSLRTLFVAIAAMTVLSYAWMFVAFDRLSDPTRLYEGTDTRAGAMLLGAAIAVGLRLHATRPAPRHMARAAPVQRHRWVGHLAVGGAVVWLAFAWATLSGTSPFLYRGGFALCGIAVGVVIVACANGGHLARALSWRPLRLLGERSYGVYLAHWPVFLWLDHARTGMSGLVLDAVRLSLVGALAWGSYALIERPIRNGSLPRWQGAVALPTALASVVATLAVATTAGPGYAAMATSPSTILARASRSGTSRGASASLVGAGENATGPAVSPSVPSTVPPTAAQTPLIPRRPWSKENPLRVFITGDSFAVQADPAIKAELESTGAATVSSGAFVGAALTANKYNWRTGWPVIMRDNRPDVVIVSLGIWDRDLATKDPTGYAALVDEAVRDILAVGADVIWVEQAAAGPVPERPGLTVFPKTPKRSVDAIYEQLPQRFPGRVAWVPTTPTFEPTGEYTPFLPGASGALERVRMPDNFHLCPAGGVRIAELVWPVMQPFALTPPSSTWAITGHWWDDQRYGQAMGGGECTKPDGAP